MATFTVPRATYPVGSTLIGLTPLRSQAPAGANQVGVQVAAQAGSDDWLSGPNTRTMRIVILKSFDGGATWGPAGADSGDIPAGTTKAGVLPTLCEMSIADDPATTKYQTTVVVTGASITTRFNLNLT